MYDGKRKQYYRIWVKRILTGMLVIVWMLLIGSFSAQSGDESGAFSTRIARSVVSAEAHVLRKNYTSQEIEKKVLALQVPVRKLAHMSEYGVLAVLLLLHLGLYIKLNRRKGSRFLLAWILSVLYATTDEIHQLFVPDRSGQPLDVCIDALGALAGVLLFYFLIKIKNINEID